MLSRGTASYPARVATRFRLLLLEAPERETLQPFRGLSLLPSFTLSESRSGRLAGYQFVDNEARHRVCIIEVEYG